MRRSVAAGVAVMALALGATTMVAAQADDDDPAASRSATFQAVEGPTTEQVPGGALLLGAYGAFMLMTIGYLAHLARLASGTQREVARLRRVLERAPTPPSRDASD